MPSKDDPFPMQSEEAQRLAESVEGSGGVGSWNKMNFASGLLKMRKSGNDDEGEVGLLWKNIRKKKSGNNNNEKASIYELAEEEEHSKKKMSNDDDDDDDFLDMPLHYSNRNIPKWLVTVERLLLKLHKRLYGDQVAPEEILRTLCLASTLFFTIGGYWLLRCLKDPVLTGLCGVEAIPTAKIMSVFVVLLVVSVYNRLLDNSNLPRHHLFYIFGTFYFLLFSIIAAFLKHPTIGLANQTQSFWRILGWVSYCGIESFGSVMVSLFWSFANSNFDLETAKASYGLLVATAQLGSILGPTLVNRNANTWGIPACYFTGAIALLFLQLTIYIYVNLYGHTYNKNNNNNNNNSNNSNNNMDQPPKRKKEKAGVLEGLKLFIKYHYVKGIFAISCLFMIEVTIVDFTMKRLANDHFAQLHPCTPGNPCWDPVMNQPAGLSAKALEAFTTFTGFFGQATNTLSLLLSFFGTSAVIRYFGFRLTLLLFPSLCLAVIIMVRMFPSLYVVFAAMMILKANSYALNNPTKEMLYQPTSPAVKYKAKSWIDMFGARGSKAVGGFINFLFADSVGSLIANGSLVGMLVASFLIWNARFMGAKFDHYMETGHIVGLEEEEEQELVYSDDDHHNSQQKGLTHLEMAAAQNDNNDTSCAIDYHDDDEIGPEEEGQSSSSSSSEEEEEEKSLSKHSETNTPEEETTEQKEADIQMV